MSNFAYHALQYMNQWLLVEEPLSGKISISAIENLDALHSALVSFKVVRNLHLTDEQKQSKTKDKQRLIPLAKLLDQKAPFTIKNANDLTKFISEFEDQLRIEYPHCKKSLTSLSTKCLWMKLKSPVIIFDSQAQKSVKSKSKNLNDFHDKWIREYNLCKPLIKDACANLINAKKYLAFELDEASIAKITSEEWFYQRVFDNYLWHVNGDERKMFHKTITANA